jgi:HNH endonuclease
MLTQAQLKELLTYDPDTGIFKWKDTGRGRSWDRVAGYKEGGNGRIRIRIGTRNYLAHRLAWLYVYGEWPKNIIDHRDLDPSNNRIKNIRDATISQNGANSKPRGKSGVKGIRKHGNKWMAKINHGGRGHYLGLFKTIEEATEAYQTEAKLLHGDFARFE